MNVKRSIQYFALCDRLADGGCIGRSQNAQVRRVSGSAGARLWRSRLRELP